MKKVQEDAQKNFIETPDFNQYFSSQSKGRSQYDKTGGWDEERLDEKDELDRIIEEHDEDDSYRKELLARMFGNKLTSRQYAVLMNISNDEEQRMELDKIHDRKTVVYGRSAIKNGEEIIESSRRKFVMQGRCSEEDSYTFIQQLLDQVNEKYPTKRLYENRM